MLDGALGGTGVSSGHSWTKDGGTHTRTFVDNATLTVNSGSVCTVDAALINGSVTCNGTITGGTLNCLSQTSVITVGTSGTFNTGFNQTINDIISNGSATINISSSTTLTTGSSTSRTWAGTLTGSGNIIKNNTSSLTINSQASTFTGNITNNSTGSGTVILGSGFTYPNSVAMNGGQTWIQNTVNFICPCIFSGTGLGVFKFGTGTVTLTGQSIHTSSNSFRNGEVIIGDNFVGPANAPTSSPLGVGQTGMQSPATMDLNGFDVSFHGTMRDTSNSGVSQNVIYSRGNSNYLGVSDGVGGIRLESTSSAGNTAFNGLNTYTGTTTLNFGTPIVSGSSGTFGTGDIACSTGQNILFDRTTNFTCANIFSGTAGILKRVASGSTTLSFSGTMGLTGTLGCDLGTLTFPTQSLSNTFTCAVNSTVQLLVGGTLNGTYGLTLSSQTLFGVYQFGNNPDLNSRPLNITSTLSSGITTISVATWTGTATGNFVIKVNTVTCPLGVPTVVGARTYTFTQTATSIDVSAT